MLAEAENPSGRSKKNLLIFVQNRDFFVSFQPAETVGCLASFVSGRSHIYLTEELLILLEPHIF